MDKRKKPKFRRKDWNKRLKLGKKTKKKRKYRAPRGIDNKIRLKEKAYAKMPSIGWGSDKKTRGKINGIEMKRIENIGQLNDVKKGQGIIIVKLGERKKQEIIKKAKEMKITILNRYKQNATG